jgi:aromatic ring-opening dioxygenase catalytic subunit (LigB family)
MKEVMFMSTDRLPTLFIPHGGGPCFFMEWPGNPHMWDRMADFLKGLGDFVGARPKAVVVISGHWEEAEFTVAANPKPPLIYDYSGFPEHTYKLQYPAPGSPELAHRVQTLLTDAGLPANIDSQRGLDHGVFIPFKLIYPNADIPIVQLSMKAGLDPATHIRAGQALGTLRDEGVLIVGSGMSFHNMRGFSPAFKEASKRFDDWLATTVSQPDATQRQAMLEHWADAPDARLTQPYPDHLLPLMVAAGAAGTDAGQRIFEDEVMNVIVSGIAFGQKTSSPA